MKIQKFSFDKFYLAAEVFGSESGVSATDCFASCFFVVVLISSKVDQFHFFSTKNTKLLE